MKQLWKRAALLALALCVALLPALAYADSGAGTGAMLDGGGNAFAFDGNASGKTVESDLYCVGQNIDASNAQIGESAILAGQYINVNNSHVGGSLRAAGYQVSAANTAVDVNATLAGYAINLGSNFSARAVYGIASTVGFQGVCDTLSLGAQSVTISGTVNGDANISAENVVLTDSAVIAGNLNVKSPNEPSIAAGATIGAYNFTLDTSAQDAAQTAHTVTNAARLVARLTALLMMLPGRILLAVLYYFIIRKSIDEAAGMMKTRPAAMPVSGLVALISVPIAAILLMVTYIGVPAGLLVLCLYALALAFAVSFAGCMLGRLCFPKLHPLVAYIIGAAGVSIVKIIPFVGGLVTFACMIYTLGYFIQKIYLGFQKTPAPAANVPGSAPAVTQSDAPDTPAPEAETPAQL